MENRKRTYAVSLGSGTGAGMTVVTEFVEAEFPDRAAEEALDRRRPGGVDWSVLAVHDALPPAARGDG